jgi:hypothetical protein
MRKLIVALTAGALVAATSLAAFAEEATGVVALIDPTAGTVTLDTGQTFLLPADFDAATLTVGQPVRIIYDEGDGDQLNATTVAPAS